MDMNSEPQYMMSLPQASDSDVQQFMRTHAASISEIAGQARSYYTGTVDDGSVACWIRQWGDLRSMGIARRLLKHLHFIDENRLVALLDVAFHEVSDSERDSAVFALFGQPYESSARITYPFTKAIGLDENELSRRWRDLRRLADDVPNCPVIMFDDNVTSGTQLVQFFSEMRPDYTERREHFDRPFSDAEWAALASRAIYLAVAVELDDSTKRVVEIRQKLGLNITVVSGSRDGKSWLTYGNELWNSQEEAEFARERISVVSRMLLSDKGWREETLENRLLGYGNVPKLTVFSHNIPKSLPAPFWKFGMVGASPWVPLFAERAEWAQHCSTIRVELGRQRARLPSGAVTPPAEPAVRLDVRQTASTAPGTAQREARAEVATLHRCAMSHQLGIDRDRSLERVIELAIRTTVAESALPVVADMSLGITRDRLYYRVFEALLDTKQYDAAELAIGRLSLGTDRDRAMKRLIDCRIGTSDPASQPRRGT
jgi:hypothetical protein